MYEENGFGILQFLFAFLKWWISNVKLHSEMYYFFDFQNDQSVQIKKYSKKIQEITWKVQEAATMSLLFSLDTRL